LLLLLLSLRVVFHFASHSHWLVSGTASDLLKNTSSSVDDAVESLSDTLGDTFDRITKKASRSGGGLMRRDSQYNEKSAEKSPSSRDSVGTMKSVKKKSKNMLNSVFSKDAK
jgi:hypothetical protein